MKIKIKDLYPNPYRDMDNYPINRDKVDALKASIKQTGFWDNIVAREKDGNIQIAYGHHRLTALREALSWDTEVDIPIRDLSDSVMIQIMANENMQEYATTPKVIDETVKVARQFLIDHPEEVGGSMEPSSQRAIASFLNWSETKVHYSLQRLNLIEEKIIDREAVQDLPTETSARTFAKTVKKHKIPVSEQRKFAERIKERESYGESAMEDAWVQEKYTPPQKKKYQQERLLNLERKIAEVRGFGEEFADGLIELDRLKKDIGEEHFVSSTNLGLLKLTGQRIIKLLTKLNPNEKESEFSSKNPERIGN